METEEKAAVEKSIGEKRVRTSFNAGADDVVAHIKNKSAELIDLCQAMRNNEAVAIPNETPAEIQSRCGEKFRLIALAQTTYEEAAMWAVKAATA